MRSDTLEVVSEVAAVAATPGSAAERAEALLAPIGRLVPFVAARIYLLDMMRRAEHPLVCVGYDENVRSYLESRQHLDELELHGLGRKGPPLRLRDMPVPPERIRSWTEYLGPAGFREGMVVRLTTSDGRYLGILGLSTDSVAHPTDAARDVLGALSPVIAAAVDPLGSIGAVTRLVGRARAGVLLTRDGSIRPLPGLPGHPVLANGSPLLGVAVAQLKGMSRASFLCPYDRDGAGTHLQVTVLACPALPPTYVTAAIVVSPPVDLRRLTRRELQVLGLVVEGHANRRIARILRLTERTVNTHLEHIGAKLGARGRTLAAVYALREGVYIPHPLGVSQVQVRRRAAAVA
ncbi:helix-turn-helix transcriptional regulator [Phytohabitans sp. ZYX-F-186]|uniref:Helix-turn-helix transcriptional regulator n=1 Tax=Phytohabitans maris TaxID=3071409 RepID=A0ABU0ZGB0_9ACTN|nr:helix-turn-helix transcriptional regulator [Phytohabitans sp. ZYX-F-186]MDQ7906070.1 helix-turn-helix transcriptional regulator [Phytohabitans sp. ZYX-F-186]